MWNDSLGWQTMKLLNSLLECNVWLTNLQFSSKSVCTDAFSNNKKKLKENLGHILFLTSKLKSFEFWNFQSILLTS